MKNTKALQKIKGKVYLYFKKNGSTILTGIAAIGTVGTAVLAVRATPKALECIRREEEAKEENLTAVEIIRYAGPHYIPAILIGTSAIACMFGANALNKKQQASLISAYAMLDQSYRQYRNKVINLYGNDADVSITDSIAKDEYDNAELCFNPSEEDNLVLFYDDFSKRFFEKTKEQVLLAEYHFNRNFVLFCYATLNQFYEMLGIPGIEGGDDLGWSMYAGDEFYGYHFVDFNHQLIIDSDGDSDPEEFYKIMMPFPPTADYLDY